MSQVFVARQPILNSRLRVVGYELLFRGGEVNEALVSNPEGATATVVLNSFTEIGLERIIGRHTGWVNVSRDFLLGGLARTMPSARIGLELLENQVIDDQLIAAIYELRRRGYRLAVDDFEYRRGSERLLPLIDVVKLDLLSLGPEALSEQVRRLKPYDVTVVAEKVETQDDYTYCAEAGCDLFQGYFFCKPELLRERRIPVNRPSMLAVTSALNDPEVELSTLERLISRDVTLSLRLLRYINSAFFGLRSEVNSIGQSLALLGLENLRRWATLTVFASIDKKPLELTVTALVRARFCELAGAGLGTAAAGQLFTLGLFSVIDALLDTPIRELLTELPFTDDMGRALTERRGPTGRLLECVLALEAGDFDRATEIVPNAGDLYVESLVWANEAADPLFGEVRVAA